MKLKEYCFKMLLKAYPNVCKSQTAEGRFSNADGTYTVYQQYAGYYFAWLYTFKLYDNPYYMDKDTLDRAISGWDYFSAKTNDKGLAHIVTYDQDWGYHADEWGLYYWINTLDLLKAYLSHDKLNAWTAKIEKLAAGVRESIEQEVVSTQYRESLNRHVVRNHFVWEVLCFYRYGIQVGRPDIMEYAAKIMDEIIDAQAPAGTWLEAGTPVVKYAEVTTCAISIYASLSNNKKAAAAVRKSLDYNLNTMYPDFSKIEVLDGRNRYSRSIASHTAPTFSDCEIGVIYLSNWAKYIDGVHANHGSDRQGLVVITDTVRLLPEDTEFIPERLNEIIPPVTTIPEFKTKILRSSPWCIPFCCIEQTTENNRWYLHRANLFSVFHEKTGLLLGGGNSISQPQMATFNVVTNGMSYYIPDSGELLSSEDGIRVSYGGKNCTLKLLEADHQTIRLQFTAEGLEETDRVYVNIPFVVKKGDTLIINGSETNLEEKFTAEEIHAGKALFFKKAEIELSEISVFNYPIFYYSPYMQKQGRNYDEAAGILTAELDYMTTSLDMKVTFR